MLHAWEGGEGGKVDGQGVLGRWVGTGLGDRFLDVGTSGG